MNYYTFKIPMYRKSTKKIDIYNANNILVGKLQRVYNNTFQKVVDNIFSKDMFINVTTYDENGLIFCEVKEQNWFKTQWKVSSNNYFRYMLINKTKINTNPRMEFELNGEQYILKKDFGDKKVYLECNNENIGFITYDKMIGSKKVEVKLKKDCIHFLEVISLYYVFFLKD